MSAIAHVQNSRQLTLPGPHVQVTDIPLQDLPLEVKHHLENYAAQLDVHIISQFIANILAAVLETVPEGNSKQTVPKAKVNHSSKHCMHMYFSSLAIMQT